MQQLGIAILLVLGVVGLFRLKTIAENYLYGHGDQARQQQQTGRQAMRRSAWIGAAVGMGAASIAVIVFIALALHTTSNLPGGDIDWLVLGFIVAVAGGGLIGGVASTGLAWLIALFRHQRR